MSDGTIIICLFSYSNKAATIPTHNSKARSFEESTLSDSFEQYRVVHLSNVPKAETKGSLTWQDFATLFSSLESKDKESWCVETDEGTKKRSLTPDSFLAPKRTKHRAYCSFLVQKDVAAYEKTESALPVVKLPNVDWSYESALWMFFGRNPAGSDDLPGRPEHTDSISADGTWHFQLSGTKKWIIRPTNELLQHMETTLDPSEFKSWSLSSRIEITCRQGDVLVIK